MLFDERPKTTKADLYNMEPQLATLVDAVRRGDPIVIILGLRRTGKTSLLLTGLALAKLPSIVVDLRAIAERPFATKKDLVQVLESAVNRFLAERKGRVGKLIERLKGIKGVQVMGTGVSFSWEGRETVQLVDVFRLLDETASRDNQRIVIAFDEAHELGKIVGFDMQRIIAHVYDYHKNTTIVLTGSSVGLLRDFVAVDDPAAPLFGRAMTEVVLGRLSAQQSREFLEKGFKQSGLRQDEKVMAMALEQLDGIIGWLTLFGSTCTRKGVSTSAIEAVREIGKKMAKREFQNFLRARLIARRRYERIMRHLASNEATWSEIKRSLQALEGRTINDRSVTQLITMLVKGGFIEKVGEVYRIGDPMLAEAFH